MENVRSGPACLCLLWFVKPAHCQFIQLYFGTLGLPYGRKHSVFNFIHCHVCSFRLVLLIWLPACASSLRRRGRVKKNPLQYLEFGLQILVQSLGFYLQYNVVSHLTKCCNNHKEYAAFVDILKCYGGHKGKQVLHVSEIQSSAGIFHSGNTINIYQISLKQVYWTNLWFLHKWKDESTKKTICMLLSGLICVQQEPGILFI